MMFLKSVKLSFVENCIKVFPNHETKLNIEITFLISWLMLFKWDFPFSSSWELLFIIDPVVLFQYFLPLPYVCLPLIIMSQDESATQLTVFTTPPTAIFYIMPYVYPVKSWWKAQDNNGNLKWSLCALPEESFSTMFAPPHKSLQLPRQIWDEYVKCRLHYYISPFVSFLSVGFVITSSSCCREQKQ